MQIYRKFLSKYLIFFSILFITLVLFMETNIGFKYIFNFANRFFTELKVEKISGNWRDFLLKNIQYDILGVSIRADSVHVKLDTKSLFTISTVFKDVQIKNLIVISNNNISNNVSKKNMLNNFSKKNIFIKNPMIFQKIYVDKFLFRSAQINILFLNILTGVQLINNDVLFLPTHIKKINLTLPDVKPVKIASNKNKIIKQYHLIEKVNYFKPIYRFLKNYSNISPVCVPLNIDLQYLKCKTIQILNNKNIGLFQIKLQAKIKENILTIKTIQIDSNIFKIQSFGKIIFHHDSSISSIVNNKIIIPELNNKSINISFKLYCNKNIEFTVKSKYLYKFKMHGSILLDNINHLFDVKLDSQNLFWPVKNKYFLKLIHVHICVKGQINNYFVSFKNKFVFRGLPTIFLHLEGQGNLKNVFFKKMKLSSVNIKTEKKIQSMIHNQKYNENILKLIGQMNIFTNIHNNIKNLYIPKIDLDLEFMKKKLSVLGSIFYQNNNVLTIPKVNFSIGKNKLFLKGFLGKKYNMYSSIYANNLNYFSPSLKGKIKAKSKLYGNDILSIFTGDMLATNLHTNSIYIKSIKIFTNMNMKEMFSGNMLIDAKKINFHNTYIHNLRIATYVHDYEQKFDFLLNNENFYINFRIHGIFNKKTRVWHVLFEKINIKTYLGQFNFQNIFSIDCNNINNIIDNFYKKSIKKQEILSSIIYNKKLSYLNIFNKSLINFRSHLFIEGYLKSFLGNNRANGKIFLKSSNIEFKKNHNKKMFLEKIDFFKISINLINESLKSEWIIKKTNASSKDDIIFGYLNIINIYNEKNINGKCYIVNFPISFLNFFANNTNETHGVFTSKIKFFGTFDQPKILADVNVQYLYIKSNNILKYITVFFPYLPKKINTIRINQAIMIKQGEILFQLYPSLKYSHSHAEWYLIFNSDNMSMFILPKIKVKFSSHLNLHYLSSKYDLIGFIKLPFFCFKINEKNFIF